MDSTPRPKLGDILTELNLVTDNQVKEALAYQKESGNMFGESLLSLGHVGEDDLSWALSSQLSLPFVAVTPAMGDGDLIALFPAEFLRRHHVLPLVAADGVMSVVLADPTDEATVERLEQISGLQTNIAVGTRSAIQRALDRALSASRGSEAPATSSGVIETLDFWERARENGASAVAFDSAGGEVQVRFRDSAQRWTTAGAISMETYAQLRDELPQRLGTGRESVPGLQVWDQPVALDANGPQVTAEAAGAGASSSVTLFLSGGVEATPAAEKTDWGDLLSQAQGCLLAAAPEAVDRHRFAAEFLQGIDVRNRRVWAVLPPSRALPGGVTRVGTSHSELAARFLSAGTDVIVGAFDSLDTLELAVRAASEGALVAGVFPGRSSLGLLARALEKGVSPTLLAENLIAAGAACTVTTSDASSWIQELLVAETPLRHALQNGGDMDSLRQAARSAGLVELFTRARQVQGAVSLRGLERSRYLEDAA